MRCTNQILYLLYFKFSATVTFCLATCIVLYKHHCNRLNYCTESMRCSVSHTRNAEVSHTCYKQTLSTNNVVYDTEHSSASAQWWMQTTVGRWTQISGGKCLNRRLLNWSKNAIFTYSMCIWHPLQGWSHQNFVKFLK